MIGIAEHCDLSCDWIIKAIFLRRSLHRLWHSAAGVTQDKLLLWLDCTSHQWCNYEINVVLIQISIWKPIIDRYSRFGGSRAYRKICSAAADDEFGIKNTWFLEAHLSNEYLLSGAVTSLAVVHLVCVHPGATAVGIYNPREYHSGITEREKILHRAQCGDVHKWKKHWRARKGQSADSTARRFLSQLLALPVCSLAAGITQHLRI